MGLDHEWEQQFMRDLQTFIIACLKDYSKTGSMTKTELVEWFRAEITGAILNHHHIEGEKV